METSGLFFYILEGVIAMTVIYGDSEHKEVYFDTYCKECKHALLGLHEEPCNECLDNPTNLYSHKPVKFEEKEE